MVLKSSFVTHIRTSRLKFTFEEWLWLKKNLIDLEMTEEKKLKKKIIHVYKNSHLCLR